MAPIDSRALIALVSLIVQNSGLAIMMRYTLFRHEGDTEEKYITSTAVMLAEMLKLAISLTLSFLIDAKGSYKVFAGMLYNEFVVNKGDWIKLSVPSVLYTIQNSLQYFSMSCLSAAVFQVLYQMKIITTAVFSVTMLNRRLSALQWIAIVALAFGVAMVQLSQTEADTSDASKSNSILGLISVLCGCMTSGFAGVYFEMVLKTTPASIWIRNIQLSFIGIITCVIACYFKDLEALQTRGFLAGYNEYVWGVIILQAAGGLIVAVVVKYADNVLKGFATSISILLSCFASFQIFHDVSLNVGFTSGAFIVLLAVFAYGYSPQQAAASKGVNV